MMNWDDLRFFLALAREGSVSGAGKVLSVKHTTVSRRITALEEKLGSNLFTRTHSGYAMTQVAENLLPHALAVEEIMHTADREIFGMDTQLSGSLRMSASYDVFSRLVTPHIHRFTERYPGIEIELVSSTSLLDLDSREADIALRLSPKPPEQLIGREIVPLRHGVYASEQYLQENSLLDQLILWTHDTDKVEWVSEHFPEARVVARVSEIITMMELVKNHHGLARMPCFVADSEPSLRRLDLSLTPSKWGVWLLSHADLRTTARVRVCREFLIEIIEQQRSVIEGLDSRYW
jgi:DNA-binding transcriptional LysR family regulator